MSGDQHVLILGSGLVCPPLVDYLSNHKYTITIASRTVLKATDIIKLLKPEQQSLIKAVEYDVETDDESLSKLNGLLDSVVLVVSMLPYIFHVKAAKLALLRKKHFFTTSYVSPEMGQLDADVKAAGLCFMNECGVDPGLDHMSAQKFIDHVHSQGGKVLSFHSLCGGLPAPSAGANPLGYKLSWSPRGVLLASRNTATYLENGHKKILPGASLYEPELGYHLETIQTTNAGVLKLEWYPNRDSTVYKDIYGIPEAQTIIRGTYRNAGWCRMMKYVSSHGLTSTDAEEAKTLWYHAHTSTPVSLAQFTYSVLTKSPNALPADIDMETFVSTTLGIAKDDDVMVRLAYLGLFSRDTVLPAPHKVPTALDVMCYLFEQKLQYSAGECDMIVMKHTFVVETAGGATETWTSTLIDIGLQSQQGFSSMARTVSLPVAMAIHAVLSGKLAGLTGVIRPTSPSVYNLILAEMEEAGVKFIEQRV